MWQRGHGDLPRPLFLDRPAIGGRMRHSALRLVITLNYEGDSGLRKQD
jgi:hypothetical protein